MDGVLIDSERIWTDVRRQYTLDHGGRWPEDAQRQMMGMSAPEWATYMHEHLHVPLEPADIVDAVAKEMAGRYRQRVPLLPGAVVLASADVVLSDLTELTVETVES